MMRLIIIFLLSLVSCSGGQSFAPSGPVKLIASESFDGGRWAPFWDMQPSVETRHDAKHYRPNTNAERFVTSPTHSGSHAAHYFIMEGTNEKTPFSIGMKHISPEVDEFYVEWHEFFEPGYTWPLGQKMLRFTRDGGGGVRDGVEVNLGALDHNNNIQVSAFNIDYEIYPYVNIPISIPEGQWVKFGVWAKLNNMGKSDGFVRAWMDDKLIASLENHDLRGESHNNWNEFWIGGNYSNQVPLRGSGSRYIDDIKWYNTYPYAPEEEPEQR